MSDIYGSDEIRPECKISFKTLADSNDKLIEAVKENTKTTNIMSNKVFNGYGKQIKNVELNLKRTEQQVEKIEARQWAVIIAVAGGALASIATLIISLV